MLNFGIQKFNIVADCFIIAFEKTSTGYHTISLQSWNIVHDETCLAIFPIHVISANFDISIPECSEFI